VHRRTASRLPSPGRPSEGARRGTHRVSRPGSFNRNRQPRRSRRAGRPPSRRVAVNVCEEPFSWKEVGARVRRAPWRARLRMTGADCSRWLGVVELHGTPRTPQRHSRNRGLQLRSLLAQSRRGICFIPGDEGIVVPPSGLEPGGAAQLPKLWFTFITRASAPSCSHPLPDSSGRRPRSCGTHPQQQMH
jgi:hypothetical protein